MCGILPPRERLKAADLPRHRADLGLIVDLDIALDHRLLERADDVAAEVQRLLHRRIELRPRQIIRILDAVARNLCTIHDERDIDHVLRRMIDARLYLHRQPQIVDMNPLVNELDAVVGVLLLRRHRKMVVVKTRDKVALERLAQKIRHIAQETIPLMEAVALVKALKILNIEIYECQRFHRRILQLYGCAAHKLHHVEESRNLTEVAFSVLFHQNEPPVPSYYIARLRTKYVRIPRSCRAGSYHSSR